MRSAVALARAQAGRNPLQSAPFARQGIEYATRAIAIDSSDADAWETRGRLRFLTWVRRIVTDANEARSALEGARFDLERATTLDKTRASAWSALSTVHANSDDLTSAKIAAQRAYDEDAFLTNIDGVIYTLYQTSYNLEQAVDAQRWCQTGYTRFPRSQRFVGCRLWLQTMRAVPVNVDSAWADAKTYSELSPPATAERSRLEAELLVAAALARAGQADSAHHMLQRVRSAATEEVDPEHDLVGIQAFVRTLFKNPKDNDEAIALLQQYVAANPAHREGMAKSQHWWWRDLMPDPRYQALVAGR
jgi:tetratricopeptide (TPR) repeat protein